MYWWTALSSSATARFSSSMLFVRSMVSSVPEPRAQATVTLNVSGSQPTGRALS